jgi:hypothetical protein
MLIAVVIMIYMPATLASRLSTVTDRTLAPLQRQQSIELHTGQPHVLQVAVSGLLLNGFKVSGPVLALTLIDQITI